MCATTMVRGQRGATELALRSRKAPDRRMSRGCSELDDSKPVSPDQTYPSKLDNIIRLFEELPEDERRETLVSYADNARKQEPRPGEQFDLEDVGKDGEGMERGGVFLE